MATRIVEIDRCYCEAKTFAELVAIAHRDMLSLRQLADQEQCGINCGWCVAYLRRALLTGKTSFTEMLPKEPIDLEGREGG